jgi:hypothetical protein
VICSVFPVVCIVVSVVMPVNLVTANNNTGQPIECLVQATISATLVTCRFHQDIQAAFKDFYLTYGPKGIYSWKFRSSIDIYN